jgi:hypothetical protein
MGAAIAFNPAFNREKEIGPDRLRAEIAAPDAARDRIHQEEGHRGEDEQAGDIIDFLRPNLDEEEIKAPVLKIDEHGLAGRIRAAVETQERQKIINTERQAEQTPFDATEGSVHRHGIDFWSHRIERLRIY